MQLDGISLPIAIGLLIMMYPVLAKVRYDRMGAVTGDKRLLASSLVPNWVLGPANDVVAASDCVVTMGCGELCTVYSGKRYLDWELDDRAGPGVDAVRPIRDAIRTRAEAMIKELAAGSVVAKIDPVP